MKMTAQRDSKLRVHSYDEALEAAGREAKATLIVAVALMLFFGAALWLLKDLAVLWLGIPLWFWVGIIGGFVLSSAAAWWIAARVVEDYPLDWPEDEAEEGIPK